MSSVLHFTPRSEIGHQENLQAFIDLCRQSDVLQARQQFDANVWDAGHLKARNQVHRAVFSTLEAATQSKSEPAFPEPFLDFAKAILVYLQDQRPVTTQSPRISALRCMEAALREWSKGSRPTAVNTDVLDTAVELAKKQFAPGAAYRVAGQLALMAGMMRAKALVALRQPWVPAMKRPADLGSRISKQAMDARQEKLPSAAALRALAGIFREATTPADVLVSSYAALMLCAPERVNEPLRLWRNCLVEGEGRFAGNLGLRWRGSKEFEDTTKWLPTSMVPVAREAIANILKATSPAQEIAAWYTADRTKLFIHEGAKHLLGKSTLTPREIALLLWGDEGLRTAANLWASVTNKLSSSPVEGSREVAYRFADVEQAVLSMLPATFPHMPGDPRLKCKEAMAIVRTNECHASKSTFLCMFSCVDYQTITNPLGGRVGRDSIFERFGYKEDDGTPIALRSHSLRHYLNMLAQMGGMTSAEIALWSGRKDVRQNRAYDHMTSDEVQAPISKALKAGFTGTLVPASDRNLVTRAEFQSTGTGAAHTTEFGYCMHNFAAEPCQMHRDCVNCEEQVCVKGEEQKEANLRQLKAETEYLLKQAHEALNDEEYGADNWVKHQAKTLDRINALLAIIDNATVPAGAHIRLDLANAPLVTNDNVRPVKFLRARTQKALK